MKLKEGNCAFTKSDNYLRMDTRQAFLIINKLKYLVQQVNIFNAKWYIQYAYKQAVL